MEKKISTGIQITVAACVLSSITYDLGYYFSAGISIATIPMNILDYIYDSAFWLPYMIILVLIGSLPQLKESNSNKSFGKESIVKRIEVTIIMYIIPLSIGIYYLE